MACQIFCRHQAIIKAHQDKIKWPSWPQAYRCLGKEGKTVNQKVALLHVPPGLLIDRNDNGPKMHHYLWPASRHQMLLSCICQNRKFCSKQTSLLHFVQLRFVKSQGQLDVPCPEGELKSERSTWFLNVSSVRRLWVCLTKMFWKSSHDSKEVEDKVNSLSFNYSGMKFTCKGGSLKRFLHLENFCAKCDLLFQTQKRKFYCYWN